MRVAVSVNKSLEWVTEVAERINALKTVLVDAVERDHMVFLVPREGASMGHAAVASARFVRKHVPGGAAVCVGDRSYYIWPERADDRPVPIEDAWAALMDAAVLVEECFDHERSHPWSGSFTADR